MEHQEAIQLGAVEKYLLDELSLPQRAEFEEHFFGCRECAADLRMTAEFLDIARKELGRGTRSTLGGPAPRPLKRFWQELFKRPVVLAPAFALLLAVIVYQNGVILPRYDGEIAQLKQPGVVTTLSLIGSNSRGGERTAVNAADNQPLLLSLDIPPAQPYPGYACELIDSAGNGLWRVPVSTQQAQDTVSISVPAGKLRPGDYTLVVRGLRAQGDRTEATDLAHYRFTVRSSRR